MADQASVDLMVTGNRARSSPRRRPRLGGDRQQTFVPSFEALNRAATIDLFFYESGNPVEDDLLTGVRFARNRVHHQWAKALEGHENPGMPLVTLASTSSRVVGPRPGFWWYWVNASELPPGKPDAAAEEQYTNRLAGRSAEGTLEALLPVLESFI